MIAMADLIVRVAAILLALLFGASRDPGTGHDRPGRKGLRPRRRPSIGSNAPFARGVLSVTMIFMLTACQLTGSAESEVNDWFCFAFVPITWSEEDTKTNRPSGCKA